MATTLTTFNNEAPGFTCHGLPSSIALKQGNSIAMDVELGKEVYPNVGKDDRKFDNCFVDVDNELVICALK